MTPHMDKLIEQFDERDAAAWVDSTDHSYVKYGGDGSVARKAKLFAELGLYTRLIVILTEADTCVCEAIEEALELDGLIQPAEDRWDD